MKNFTPALILSCFILFLPSSSMASVTYEEFKQLKEITFKVFEELKPSDDYHLFINKQPTTYTNPNSTEEKYWWNLDLINASFFKIENKERKEFYLTVFGGFAKQEFMDPDALAVTLCHELAHGLGGDPVKENGTTTEGQADYFATNICLPLFYEHYPRIIDAVASNPYIEDLCSREDARGNKKYCIRAMNALHADMKFFELLGGKSRYEAASKVRPSEFNLNSTFYPEAQCRIDLMIHGILDLLRPNCFDPFGIERVL